MTDPVKFEDEKNVPPVIVDDPALPVGSIIKVDFDALQTNTITLPIKLRDDNVDDELEVHTRIIESNGPNFLYDCTDPPIVPVSGSADRSYNVVIDKSSLNAGECHKVEVAVSSDFNTCPSKADVAATFDAPHLRGDLARATFWIWDVSKDALSNPTAAQTLAMTCAAIELDSAMVQ